MYMGSIHRKLLQEGKCDEDPEQKIDRYLDRDMFFYIHSMCFHIRVLVCV